MGVDCLNAKPAKLHHRRACPCGMMIESQKNAAPQPTPPKKDGLGSPFLAINHRSAGASPAVAETIQPAQPASLNSAERDPAGRRSCGRGGARSRRRLTACAPKISDSAPTKKLGKHKRLSVIRAQAVAGGAQRKNVPGSKRERGAKVRRKKAKGKRQKVPRSKYENKEQKAKWQVPRSKCESFRSHRFPQISRRADSGPRHFRTSSPPAESDAAASSG